MITFYSKTYIWTLLLMLSPALFAADSDMATDSEKDQPLAASSYHTYQAASDPQPRISRIALRQRATSEPYLSKRIITEQMPATHNSTPYVGYISSPTSAQAIAFLLFAKEYKHAHEMGEKIQHILGPKDETYKKEEDPFFPCVLPPNKDRCNRNLTDGLCNAFWESTRKLKKWHELPAHFNPFASNHNHYEHNFYWLAVDAQETPARTACSDPDLLKEHADGFYIEVAGHATEPICTQKLHAKYAHLQELAQQRGRCDDCVIL